MMKKLSVVFSVFVILFFCFTMYTVVTGTNINYIIQSIKNEKFDYKNNINKLKIGLSTLNENEKKIYNLIYHSIDRMEKSVNIKATKLEDVERIYNYYLNDSPEHFYVQKLSYKVTHDNKVVEIIFDYYYSKEDKENKQKLIDEEAKKVIDQASILGSDFEKSKFIHDYIINKAKYTSDDSNSIYWIDGVLLENKAVCQSYGKTYQYLMNLMGYKALYVRGTSRNENHGWNLVELENNFYYLDPTWDDVEKTKKPFIDYTYFHITEEEIRRDHQIDPSKNCELPKATAKDLNYYVKNNLLITNYKDKNQQNIILNLITNGIKENKDVITFKFSTKQQLQEFLNDSTLINQIILNAKKLANNQNIEKYSFIKNEFLLTLNLMLA